MVGVAHLKALVALGTLICFALTVAWYGWLEPSWLTYRAMPFAPLVEQVVAGEAIPLRVIRCNSSGEEKSYLISHRLVRLDKPAGGQPDVILTPGLVDLDPGCKDEVSKANVPPKDTLPGIYFVRGRAKTEGLWRSIYVPWSSRPFRVVAPAASAP